MSESSCSSLVSSVSRFRFQLSKVKINTETRTQIFKILFRKSFQVAILPIFLNGSWQNDATKMLDELEINVRTNKTEMVGLLYCFSEKILAYIQKCCLSGKQAKYQAIAISLAFFNPSISYYKVLNCWEEFVESSPRLSCTKRLRQGPKINKINSTWTKTTVCSRIRKKHRLAICLKFVATLSAEDIIENNFLFRVYLRLAIPGLFFFIFIFSIQMYNWQIKFCRCWDLNCRSLVLEATALPTEPPPLPNFLFRVNGLTQPRWSNSSIE